MPPKPKFANGESVLCYHRNFIYEAKCLKSETKDKAVRYFIHYNGWKKNWDEWVPEHRVLKMDEAGLKKRKELLEAIEKCKAPKANAGAIKGQGGRPKKDKDKEKDTDKNTGKGPERASTPSSEKNEKRKSFATTDRERNERDRRSSTPTVEQSPKQKPASATKTLFETIANCRESKANVGASRGQVGRPRKDRDKSTEKGPERASTPSSERTEKRKSFATADCERNGRGSRSSTPTVEPSPKRKAAATTTPVATKSQPEACVSNVKELFETIANCRGSNANVGAMRGQVGRQRKDNKEKEKDKDKNIEKSPERASTPSLERTEKRKSFATTDRERNGRGSRPSTPTVELSSKRKTAAATTPVVNRRQPETRGSDVKRKRTRADTGTDSEDTTNTNKPEFRLRIPNKLKPWLVDDGDLINRQKKLLSLPCSKTVDDILEEYVKVRLASGTNQQKDAVNEITQGIRDYFNVVLGTQLLYRFERIQYQELLADHKDTPLCKIYGANHLLRLFVKLGSLLEYTSLDESCLKMLSVHLQDVLKYMAEQSELLFNVDDYQAAPSEYHSKAL